MKKNILIVEDNKDIRDTIRIALEQENFGVTTASNAQALFTRLKSLNPDLILLDLMLPDANGLNLLEKIREQTSAPIIIVSGKGDLVDKVLGLEMGADDYISKPFQLKELIARVKVRVRKKNTTTETGTPETSLKKNTKISIGRWTLDKDRMQVFDQNQQSANLTVKEFRLFEAFVNAPNIVLSREQLLDKSRLNDFNVTDRAIDTQIARIRKKLGEEGDDSLIQSIRGAGYILAVNPVAKAEFVTPL